MDLFDKTTDTRHQLSNFKSQMYLVDASDATHYKAFPTTLTKATMKWFDNLPPRSVTCFNDLSRKFFTRFLVHKIAIINGAINMVRSIAISTLYHNFAQLTNKCTGSSK
ncbi:hypothetical protein AHAS_Ahas09G0133800 [Arachis hypogaea]